MYQCKLCCLRNVSLQFGNKVTKYKERQVRNIKNKIKKLKLLKKI